MADKRKYVDRAEYIKQAVSRRRKKLKLQSIIYKGGQCIFCGYKRCIDALEFHHLNEKNKDFGLSQDGLTRSWQRTKGELEKCIIVCSNCHREIHKGIRQLSDVNRKGKTR